MNSLLINLLALQQNLNDDSNGPGWESGVNKYGKKINWGLCVTSEAMELIDSFAWEHWKLVDRPIDLPNAKTELVDIFHFVMSEVIRVVETEVAYEELDEAIDKSVKYLDSKNNNECKSLDIISECVRVLIITFNSKSSIDEKFFAFWDLMDAMGVSFRELAVRYLAKNALNTLRQDNGYAKGTYNKFWNGKEDNYYAQTVADEIISSGSETPTVGIIYSKLQEIYMTTN